MRLLAPLLLAACTGTPAPAPTPEPEATTTHAAVDMEDPSTCAACHGAVVEEWSTSMHAHAHHDKDPIYAGMRRIRMKKEGEAIAGKCAQCHNPRDPGNPDSAAGKQGVSCATCHNAAEVDGSGEKKGAKAIRWAEEGVLRGVHASSGAMAPHGLGEPAGFLKDGKTMCLACHGQMKNAADVVTCNTGPEHEEAASGQACTTCHMPEVEGPSGSVSTRDTHRSHAFLGPHTAWQGEPDFLATSVDASLSLEGTQLSLGLKNASGHAVPSAFPGRMMLARAVGKDANGVEIWTNWTDDPMGQDEQSVFNKVYHDADGKVTLPPYGVTIVRDSRLSPGETRTLSWTVPDDVTTAEVKLIYRLVPPPAVQAFGLEGHDLAKPQVFATVTAEEE